MGWPLLREGSAAGLGGTCRYQKAGEGALEGAAGLPIGARTLSLTSVYLMGIYRTPVSHVQQGLGDGAVLKTEEVPAHSKLTCCRQRSLSLPGGSEPAAPVCLWPCPLEPPLYAMLRVGCKGLHALMTLLLQGCPAVRSLDRIRVGDSHWGPVEEGLLTANGPLAGRLDANSEGRASFLVLH